MSACKATQTLLQVPIVRLGGSCSASGTSKASKIRLSRRHVRKTMFRMRTWPTSIDKKPQETLALAKPAGKQLSA